MEGTTMELRKNDPEFAERFQHFAFDEVVNEENQQLVRALKEIDRTKVENVIL